MFLLLFYFLLGLDPPGAYGVLLKLAMSSSPTLDASAVMAALVGVFVTVPF